MRKSTMIKSILVAIILVGVLSVTLMLKANGKTRQCPDEWYQNEMPKVTEGQATHSQPEGYFVIDGSRRELSEFDMDWVKEHCKVTPTKVY